MGKQNHVSIAWIPAHAGIHNNEVADYLAKSESKSERMALNLVLQFFIMPVVVARLRIDPQIDKNLSGINGKTA